MQPIVDNVYHNALKWLQIKRNTLTALKQVEQESYVNHYTDLIPETPDEEHDIIETMIEQEMLDLEDVSFGESLIFDSEEPIDLALKPGWRAILKYDDYRRRVLAGDPSALADYAANVYYWGASAMIEDDNGHIVRPTHTVAPWAVAFGSH